MTRETADKILAASAAVAIVVLTVFVAVPAGLSILGVAATRSTFDWGGFLGGIIGTALAIAGALFVLHRELAENRRQAQEAQAADARDVAQSILNGMDIVTRSLVPCQRTVALAAAHQWLGRAEYPRRWNISSLDNAAWVGCQFLRDHFALGEPLIDTRRADRLPASLATLVRMDRSWSEISAKAVIESIDDFGACGSAEPIDIHNRLTLALRTLDSLAGHLQDFLGPHLQPVTAFTRTPSERLVRLQRALVGDIDPVELSDAMGPFVEDRDTFADFGLTDLDPISAS